MIQSVCDQERILEVIPHVEADDDRSRFELDGPRLQQMKILVRTVPAQSHIVYRSATQTFEYRRPGIFHSSRVAICMGVADRDDIRAIGYVPVPEAPGVESPSPRMGRRNRA